MAVASASTAIGIRRSDHERKNRQSAVVSETTVLRAPTRQRAGRGCHGEERHERSQRARAIRATDPFSGSVASSTAATSIPVGRAPPPPRHLPVRQRPASRLPAGRLPAYAPPIGRR